MEILKNTTRNRLEMKRSSRLYLVILSAAVVIQSCSVSHELKKNQKHLTKQQLLPHIH